MIVPVLHGVCLVGAVSFSFSSLFFSEFSNVSFFSQTEPGASPAGRDNSPLQFSACREQIWRVFRKLLPLMVGKCLQILEGTQCKYPLLIAAPRAGAAGGPGAGTITRAAFASAFCSPKCLLLRYPSCDLSKELGLPTASAQLHLPRRKEPGWQGVPVDLRDGFCVGC